MESVTDVSGVYPPSFAPAGPVLTVVNSGVIANGPTDYGSILSAPSCRSLRPCVKIRNSLMPPSLPLRPLCPLCGKSVIFGLRRFQLALSEVARLIVSHLM